MAGDTFSQSLAELEMRAFEVQMTHFKIPPEDRGRAFYAMELVGEMGELLNDCKKFIRTKLAHRRDEQVRSRIPEEAADTLVALMLVKLAARDARQAHPSVHSAVKADDLGWLHSCLSALALRASTLYAEEALKYSSVAGSEMGERQAGTDAHSRDFNLELYESVVERLLQVATFFGFDLEEATQSKLTAIIGKVEAGHYD